MGKVVYSYFLKTEGNLNLSENFKVKEFSCKDGSDTVKIDTITVDYLQMARNLIGHAITVNSGYRTPLAKSLLLMVTHASSETIPKTSEW